jgi:hypothetical protein
MERQRKGGRKHKNNQSQSSSESSIHRLLVYFESSARTFHDANHRFFIKRFYQH